MLKYKIIVCILKHISSWLKPKTDKTENTIDDAIVFEINKIILDLEAKIKGEVK